MRTSRILEMIYLLLNNRQQTAEELAEHFNVSIKTVYRDVDTLSKAGIPISKQQGVHGGVILSKDYAINRSKLTETEENALLAALANIKKLPNSQLEYALKLLKQYFNEAGTFWINTDDVSLDIQDKFHKVKRAVIEKNEIEFEYFTGSMIVKYKAEPYEVRNDGDVWKILIWNMFGKTFEEVYLSRMTGIQIRTKQFKRKEIPDKFSKRYDGFDVMVTFEVNELTDELLNRFPIENFDFTATSTYLKIRVKAYNDAVRTCEKYRGLKIVAKI